MKDQTFEKINSENDFWRGKMYKRHLTGNTETKQTEQYF